MGKRGRVLVVASAVALSAVLAWAVLHAPAPEPVYEGKPLSYWLQAYGFQPSTNRPTVAEANNALNEIGTNAIPTLYQMLRAHDPPLKNHLLTWAMRHRICGIHYSDPISINLQAMMGFRALALRPPSEIPDLIKILDHNFSPDSRGCTASVLGNNGPEAELAVPALLRVATSTEEFECNSALLALGRIHADPGAAVPVLIKVLDNPSPWIRANAVYALGNYGGEAKSAVPALVAMLNDPNVNSNSTTSPYPPSLNIRTGVKDAIQKIDPETYIRVVTNPALDSTR